LGSGYVANAESGISLQKITNEGAAQSVKVQVELAHVES